MYTRMFAARRHACTYTFTYSCRHVYTNACMYIRMHACVYTCMYVYTYTCIFYMQMYAHIISTWSRMWELGISFFNLHATPICDSGSSKLALVGVLTISAPNAFRMFTYKQRTYTLLPMLPFHAAKLHSRTSTWTKLILWNFPSFSQLWLNKMYKLCCPGNGCTAKATIANSGCYYNSPYYFNMWLCYNCIYLL